MPLGQPPQRAEVGVAGVAVEQHDRRADQQAADEQVPHHPAGGGEPEEAVAGAEVVLQRAASSGARATIPPWPCTMPLGSPVVPEEYSTHSGWSNGTGSNSSGPGSAVNSAQATVSVQRRARRRGRAPARWPAAWAAARCSARDGRPDVEPLAAVDVAVDGEQHRGSIWANRSRTARAPKSGEHDDQIAPRLAAARNATSVSTLFGASATTRSPRPTPSATRPARARPTSSRSSPWVTGRSSPSSRANDHRDVVVGRRAGAQRVLGVVQRGARGTTAGPASVASPARRGGASWNRTPRNSAAADQKPSRSSTDHACSARVVDARRRQRRAAPARSARTPRSRCAGLLRRSGVQRTSAASLVAGWVMSATPFLVRREGYGPAEAPASTTREVRPARPARASATRR